MQTLHLTFFADGEEAAGCSYRFTVTDSGGHATDAIDPTPVPDFPDVTVPEPDDIAAQAFGPLTGDVELLRHDRRRGRDRPHAGVAVPRSDGDGRAGRRRRRRRRAHGGRRRQRPAAALEAKPEQVVSAPVVGSAAENFIAREGQDRRTLAAAPVAGRRGAAGGARRRPRRSGRCERYTTGVTLRRGAVRACATSATVTSTGGARLPLEPPRRPAPRGLGLQALLDRAHARGRHLHPEPPDAHGRHGLRGGRRAASAAGAAAASPARPASARSPAERLGHDASSRAPDQRSRARRGERQRGADLAHALGGQPRDPLDAQRGTNDGDVVERQTAADGMPSPRPRATSVGISRIVRVAGTASTWLSTGIASSRVRIRNGRRPARGCSYHQTSPRFTTARGPPRAPRVEACQQLGRGDVRRARGIAPLVGLCRRHPAVAIGDPLADGRGGALLEAVDHELADERRPRHRATRGQRVERLDQLLRQLHHRLSSSHSPTVALWFGWPAQPSMRWIGIVYGRMSFARTSAEPFAAS